MKPRGMKDFVDGPVINHPGNSTAIRTGSWRSSRPVWQQENCTACLFCWLYCPDMSVVVTAGKMAGFDYDYCKGCGICALECPGKRGQKAIVMQKEEKG